MRFFFQTFLYVNVGIGALFFGIWLWTAFFPFSTGAQAEKKPPATNTTSPAQKEVSTNKGGAPSTSSAQKEVSANKEGASSISSAQKEVSANKEGASSISSVQKEVSANKEGASSPSPANRPVQDPAVSDLTQKPVRDPAISDLTQKPVQDPAVSDLTQKPVQDPAVSDLTQKPVDQEPEGGNRTPSSDLSVPPPPPQGGSRASAQTALNRKIKSAQNIGKKAGVVGGGLASELMDVNQRVVAIEKIMSPYEYDPSERRDPFIPFRPKGPEIEEQEILNHATSDYELSEIKLIGMKWGKGPGLSKAMFRTPDSEIHYLQANDRIGNGGAIIDRLEEDKVIVLEPRFAVESQSQSFTDGAKRVFVPKIIYLDRFVSQKRDDSKKQDRSPVSAVSPQARSAPAKTQSAKNKKATPPSS